MTWRDISTAPKDGTTVLLLCEDYNSIKWEVCAGYWSRDAWKAAGTEEQLFWAKPRYWMRTDALPPPPGEER